MSATPLWLALLLALLQAATPFAHAMVHVASAHASAQSTHRQAPEWNAVTADEKPCALCAADHLPALPQTRSVATAVVTARSVAAPALASPRSSAPLDVFCRPPPAA